ncbi:MAG TPA: L-rhamnose isomerase, partial [Verrucomicrobiota bacterium]|nr:L-rhamnose isomerase [Verrucomicrobiota bacterium]
LAMLAPIAALKRAELERDYTSRLALMEEAKSLPFGPVWDYACLEADVPAGETWLAEVKRYEADVLLKR